MTTFQHGTPAPRRGGELSVYTALLGVALVTLILGIVVVIQANIDLGGGPLDLLS